jgi:phenylacetate-coenzyme A ligase PaaK-like adenylate-forming protein
MGLKINQATSLQREREEQMRWSLRNSVPSRQRVEALLSRMLENEFRDLEEMQERIRQRLQEFLLFAVRQVPYYREIVVV